jgi:hypothetical protein
MFNLPLAGVYPYELPEWAWGTSEPRLKRVCEFAMTMKVLFVFLVLEHRRREVLHFNVTEHPSAAWTSQQIVEAFANQDAPQYLLRDRDRIYGKEVGLRISSLQMEEVLTAPRSPWQNPSTRKQSI